MARPWAQLFREPDPDPEFIVVVEPMANLRVGNMSLPGYLLVSHGEQASSIQALIHGIKGIADCFPPTNDNFLGFRCYPHTLGDKLHDHEFLRSLKCPTSPLKTDKCKQIIKVIGCMAVRCFTNNVHLDLRSSHIFLGGSDYTRVKGVAAQGDVQDFNVWKQDLLRLYKEIGGAFHSIDVRIDLEFQLYMDLLVACEHLSDVELLLSSWIFWNKQRRLKLMYSLDDLAKNAYGFKWFDDSPNKFQEFRNWEEVITRDFRLEALIRQYRPKDNDFSENQKFYQLHQMMRFFIFLRTIFGHFSSQHFSNEEEFLTHLESTFWNLMKRVYEICSDL